ncbi:VOC family protein [Halobacillus yeomjeoni]|uniref:VOC family protein n=1 Tax=Halobacillus yeomjeoni TaxID=311194 RepID=UPI001CD3C082|nr:VOC family protein [Halobacillus yeomjeoni]MCA0983538.1 VOC family protein [Halobacillus yeomjeoni]
MFERIDTMCLTVSNVEKASNWYQNVLGLTVSFSGEGYRVLSVGNSSVPLTIEEGNTDSDSNNSYPIFFTKDIKEAHENLNSQGVQIDQLHNDGVNNFFDFYDLDGNKMQVCFFE